MCVWGGGGGGVRGELDGWWYIKIVFLQQRQISIQFGSLTVKALEAKRL